MFQGSFVDIMMELKRLGYLKIGAKNRTFSVFRLKIILNLFEIVSSFN